MNAKNAGTGGSDPKEFYVVAGYSKWKERLVTKDDPIHLHKFLGITCLMSFMFRVVQINESDMGFQTRSAWTVPTIAIHFLLSASSFAFKIPHRRIKEGSRIWPEYRLHSIVFASRSLAAMLIFWIEDHYQIERPLYWLNVFLVLATCAAADACTASQKHQSNSIRDLDISRWTSYFFSVAQFYATAGVLFGVRRFTIQFLNVFVVQLNPFLMTLRRKNLISHYATVTIYGFLLIFGMFVCIYEYTRYGVAMLRTIAFVGNVAILWRTTPLPITGSTRNIFQNKYLIWSVMGIVVQYIRPLALQEMSKGRQSLYTLIMTGVLFNGYWKCTGMAKPIVASTESTNL